MRPAEARKKLARVLPALRRAYGPREWEPRSSPVDVLVGTILSQNTTGSNSSAGLRQLRRRFPSWSAAADAPIGQIAQCIRICGLSRIKAPRIKKILRQVRSRCGGRVSLGFLRKLPVDEATAYLLGLDGVGPKTAACVLMFAFGKEVFPVDTHVRRIAVRLGLIVEGISAEQAQQVLTPLIRPGDRYEMHVLLIAHGRQTCRARNPLCGGCLLMRMCPRGRASQP